MAISKKIRTDQTTLAGVRGSAGIRAQPVVSSNQKSPEPSQAVNTAA